MDPYALASKYCHKFVNIHPFLDGNGRMCRLIMNGLLPKYAGIAVPFGGTEEERNEYLGIVAGGNKEKQIEEDERCRVPWAELCVLCVEEGQ
jgi:fido (protein-threonine AMPylation protein)